MGTRDRLTEANDRLDPKVDTFLSRIAAGRCSACWVVGYGLARLALGALLF